MIPLKVFSEEARRTIDITDPKQTRRFTHVQDVEAALFAAADLYEHLSYPPSPLIAHIQSLPAYQNNLIRLDYPVLARRDLGTISAHHLPRNPFLHEPS